MIVDLTNAEWIITPDLRTGAVEIVVEAEGRRFSAQLTDALERALSHPPRTGPVDLSRYSFVEIYSDGRGAAS